MVQRTILHRRFPIAIPLRHVAPRSILLKASIVVLGLASFPGPALSSAKDPGSGQLLQAGVVEATAQEKLDRILPVVNFDGQSLRKVIDRLHEMLGVTFVSDWKEIEDAGVDPNIPVSMNVHNVKRSKALTFILVTVANENVKLLGYRVEGNKVHISTSKILEKAPAPNIS